MLLVSVYLILLFPLIVVSFSPSVFFFRCVLHPLPLPLSSCLGCIPPLNRATFPAFFMRLPLGCFKVGGWESRSVLNSASSPPFFLFNVSLVTLLGEVCNQRGARPLLTTSSPSFYPSLACFPGRLNCTTAPRGGDTTSPLPLRIPIRLPQTTLSF